MNSHIGHIDIDSKGQQKAQPEDTTKLTLVFSKPMKKRCASPEDNAIPGKNQPTQPPHGRNPRIAKQMALAIHLQKLIDTGAIRDYAELARITGLSRARITQIMNLNLLAPRIQEELLFLPKIRNGHDPITERILRPVTSEPEWNSQMKEWLITFN